MDRLGRVYVGVASTGAIRRIGPGGKLLSRANTAQFSAVARSSEQPCQRTVRKPLTRNSAMTCTTADAVHRSSRPFCEVERRWEQALAPNLLPRPAHHRALTAVEEHVCSIQHAASRLSQ